MQKHIFFPGSFFCSANAQHDTEFLSPNNEFFSANNMYPVIFDLWLLHVVELDSSLKIPFPTEIYRQQEIILNCLQIGKKINFLQHSYDFYCGFAFVL